MNIFCGGASPKWYWPVSRNSSIIYSNPMLIRCYCGMLLIATRSKISTWWKGCFKKPCSLLPKPSLFTGGTTILKVRGVAFRRTPCTIISTILRKAYSYHHQQPGQSFGGQKNLSGGQRTVSDPPQ